MKPWYIQSIYYIFTMVGSPRDIRVWETPPQWCDTATSCSNCSSLTCPTCSVCVCGLWPRCEIYKQSLKNKEKMKGIIDPVIVFAPLAVITDERLLNDGGAACSLVTRPPSCREINRTSSIVINAPTHLLPPPGPRPRLVRRTRHLLFMQTCSENDPWLSLWDVSYEIRLRFNEAGNTTTSCHDNTVALMKSQPNTCRSPV